jgi:predicted NodU family carbamoyl transferase
MNEIILGINGWFKRTHDPSACIIINGELVAMAEEERFIRKKHAFGKVPYNSIAFCLNKAKITLDDVDKVAVGWNYKKLYGLAGVKEPSLNKLEEVYFPKKYFEYNDKLKIEMIDHHLAHAASSYYSSGFKNASIISIDGQGEDDSGCLAVGENGKINIIKKFPIKDSLGYFYDAITQYIGFDFMSAGRTMGLASYGNAKYEFEEIKLTDDGYKVDIKPRGSRGLDKEEMISKTWLRLLPRFGPKNVPQAVYNPTYAKIIKNVKLSQKHKDIAASAQKTLEETILHLTKIVVNETGYKNLCLSGGVALNCSMNGFLLRSGIIKDIYIPPFPNDIGVSIGAGLLVSDMRPKKRLIKINWGPEFSDKLIEKILKEYSVKYIKVANIEKKVAQLIYKGNIVSCFQGRMEVGPRALGNRSILGNPCLPNTHDKLNRAKDRENWRPLAPSFIAEEMDEYLEDSTDSPFMILSFKVKKKYHKTLPALVHIDGTTRPQSVTKGANPQYYRLIKHFQKLSGFPVVMNTSFNGRGEPIVCNPYDALKSFYSNKTDYLAIGNYLVSKK